MLVRLFGLMVLRGAIYGTLGPFLSIVLLRNGLPLEAIGPLAGVGAVITLGSAPWWGRLGDLFGRRRTLALAMVVTVPVMIGLDLRSLPLVVIAASGWSFVAAAYVPLGDSLTLDRIGGDRALFARMRIGASCGYMTANITVGALIATTPLGWSAPALAGAIVALATFAVIAARMRGELRTGRGVAWIPPEERARAGEGSAPASAVGPQGGVGPGSARPTPGAPAPLPSSLGQARRFAPFLLGMIGVFAGANAPAIFVGPRVDELGGSGLDVGIATAAGTLLELPAYLTMGLVIARLGARRTFLGGSILLCLSGVVTALAPTAGLVVAARLLAGAGYSWMIIPSVAAIAAAGGPRERASLTGLHFATSAAGTIVVAAIGVPLVALSGASDLVLAGAALLVPLGAVLAVAGWPVPYDDVGEVPTSIPERETIVV